MLPRVEIVLLALFPPTHELIRPFAAARTHRILNVTLKQRFGFVIYYQVKRGGMVRGPRARSLHDVIEKLYQ